MRQRGRKSSEHLAMIAVDGRPAYLTPPELELFEELIAGCAPHHFRPSDLPVLVSLVQATLLARSAGMIPTRSPTLSVRHGCRLRWRRSFG
jgi:hypothetical protein